MTMFSDYKSYKKFTPDYAGWKSARDLAEAKRLEYLHQNPQDLNLEDIKKGKTLLRAIDIMDEYSQKRAEDMEVATEQVVSIGTTLVLLGGAAFGKFLNKNKFLIKLSEKISKTPAKILPFLSMGAGMILASALSAFPLYAWAAKQEVKASRKGRFEAMRKELNDEKVFATLNSEQEEKFNKTLESLPVKKDSKNPVKGIKENFETIKEMTSTSSTYLKQKAEFENRIKQDKEFFDTELPPEEIENAKRDQQLLTKLVEKIDIASQDYAENAELATNTLTTIILGFGSLFSLGYEKLAAKMKWKSSAIPHILSFAAMLGISIFSASIQKEASRVGRYKVKQELIDNPEQLAYVNDEKLTDIENVKVNPYKKTSMVKFLKEAWKNQQEFKKWQKTEGAKEKNISKALENIELTPEQLKDAKRLQYNTFKTFNKIDENSQKYSESVEALGQSIQAPIMELCSLIGMGFALKYLLKANKADTIANYMKYCSICFLSTLPGVGLNAIITKEQKKASRIADMLAIKEMNDYRNFADYSKNY